jgi:hypothetical protein
MGMRFHFLGALTIPVLATSKYGWRAAPVSFGVGCAVLGVLWNFCAVNTPGEWRGPPVMKDDERALCGLAPSSALSKGPITKATVRSGALETYFFRVPRAYLPILGHSIIAIIDNGIPIWAPTRYLNELGCSPVQAGIYIAMPNIADFCSQFILGAC